MLLAGKKILITGVLTPQSIAYIVAELAQQQGAEIVLTGFGRGMSLTERSAKRLDPAPEVLELDVTNPEHFPKLRETLAKKWDRLDGIVHAIGFAPEDALGGNFLNTPWESVSTAFRVSTFSLKEISTALAPLMPPGSGIVTLDFDNTNNAWPIYDWMGVCKAALTSTVRYLARDLGPKGIRVNSLAAGPLVTMAAKGIPGFKTLEKRWPKQAPLGWDSRTQHGAVARTTVALLSDWLPATTGEMVHVDGGYHAVGAAPIDPDLDENNGPSEG
ncbi:enoyl-ACP reductase FabI [Vulgatibacter incomptus]|uniref:Enoyl-[acyl-carrier-protein] reductase [NADH] n=1 Tax=Vulgatibacter incomptus TaxID=1391653 RepID=A0A0K1PCQ2_9BACT|nr:enoyl-ACP reductase FabI [Vulgatibacter incomptus]AKU91196.1 Enoyl-[acyl-carrier-protein] reductase [Vulgatibacter incomptus]